MNKIKELTVKYLGEGAYNKAPVDIMFKKKGNKAELTYVNPKSKGLPNWVKQGGSFPYQDIVDLEQDFGVYNAEGWTQKDGFIVD